MPEFEIPSGNEFLDQDMGYESMLSFFEEALITSVDLGQNYIYGFNSMEKDDEVKERGNSYAFGARMHNPRLGRFFAVDPLADQFPWLSPYVFAENNPIAFIDINGESAGRNKPKTRAVLVPFDASQVVSNVTSQIKTTGPSPSPQVIAMIVSFENLSLTMYDLDGDPNGNATIGFGHKIHDDAIDGRASEDEFKNGITIDKAAEMLAQDIESINSTLQNRVKNRSLSGSLSQSEYDVAFDLEFNTGNSNKYLDKLKNLKGIEATGDSKKADKERGQIHKWLTKQYPGNDKKRGIARAIFFDGNNTYKQMIIEEIEIKPN